LFHILQAIVGFTPKSVQDVLGNGYGLFLALFVAVLALGIVGLVVYRLLSGASARRRKVTSGRQAYERLSRRV
jgi:membrane protein required for beta-lactamase induction